MFVLHLNTLSNKYMSTVVRYLIFSYLKSTGWHVYLYNTIFIGTLI